MSNQGILPVKLSLTEGDFYTLWAPKWKEHGAEWQAFLGDGEGLCCFRSPADLLTFLESDAEHDLKDHPKWGAFSARKADRVVPDEKGYFDIIGAPAFLADRPSHANVSALDRVFSITRSLGEVTGAQAVAVFFATHSVLNNVKRGSDHYIGEHGLSEWSGVGRAVLANWQKIIDALDPQVRMIDVDEATSKQNEARIDEAVAAAEAARKAAAERRAKEAEEVDPYDASAWGQAGIDPIKITIDGRTVYTLRTFVEGTPVFLGRFGEIFTFNNKKSLVRWIMSNDEHDMATLATWPDLVAKANAGELEVMVHDDNVYSYRGLAEDIAKGPAAVDTEQMSRGYELFADAADWAADDSLNSFLLANPRMQDYISYMLGATETSGYVPSAPYTDHVNGWTALEEMLTKRFSKL